MAATPAPVAPPAPARLVLTVSPPGPVRILFDGVSTSSTLPLSLDEVTPGTHTLSVLRDGYVAYNESMQVTSGEFKPVHVELVKAPN